MLWATQHGHVNNWTSLLVSKLSPFLRDMSWDLELSFMRAEHGNSVFLSLDELSHQEQTVFSPRRKTRRSKKWNKYIDAIKSILQDQEHKLTEQVLKIYIHICGWLIYMGSWTTTLSGELYTVRTWMQRKPTSTTLQLYLLLIQPSIRWYDVVYLLKYIS